MSGGAPPWEAGAGETLLAPAKVMGRIEHGITAAGRLRPLSRDETNRGKSRSRAEIIWRGLPPQYVVG